MKNVFSILFFVFYFLSGLHSQNGKPFSVYLVGDAGEDTLPGKTLLRLKEQLLSHPNSAVVFMGDNAYPAGLKANDRNSEQHLESQLQILKEYKGQVYFLPGNHDWAAQGRSGLKRLKVEQEYTEAYLKANSTVSNKNESTFLPENGLPGPSAVKLNDRVELVIIDTQWFLHQYKKNKTGSKRNTTDLFFVKLDSILDAAKKNNMQVILTAHHPMFTNGEHSRHLQPWRFLINYTPFRLFGVMGLSRVLTQDLDDPRYKKMRRKLLLSINKYDNVIYASGHDHNLQYFNEGKNRYIISGSGSKLSPLRKKKRFGSIYENDRETGFFELDYESNFTGDIIVYPGNESPVKLEATKK